MNTTKLPLEITLKNDHKKMKTKNKNSKYYHKKFNNKKCRIVPGTCRTSQKHI